MSDRRFDREVVELLKEVLDVCLEERILEGQRHFRQRARYWSVGGNMADPITSSPVGSTVQVVLTLVPPSGFAIPDGYVYSPTLTSPEPSAVITPATVDATGGATPLAQQFTITDPSLTATATDPNGNTVTSNFTFQWTTGGAGAVFTQTAQFFPVPTA